MFVRRTYSQKIGNRVTAPVAPPGRGYFFNRRTVFRQTWEAKKMPKDMPHPAALPPWWTKPTLTFPDISYHVAAPFDTVYGWHRLAKAMGIDCGDKLDGRWSFTPCHLYAFAIVGALYRLGMPIGLPQIRAAFDFASKGTAGPFYQLSEDQTAYVAVAAPKLFDAVMTHCEAAHA